MFDDLDSDGIDAAFAALRDRGPEPPFVPASTVRRRGRRRTHRRIALTGIAVVGAVSAAGALATGPIGDGRGAPAASATPTASVSVSGPQPSESAGKNRRSPPTPDATAFPDSLFLDVSDLPGFTHRADYGATSLNWPVILMCTGFSQDDYSSLPLAQTGRGFNYAPEAPNAANMGSGGPYASHRVVRFTADGATKVFANVDAFHTCRKKDGDRELARDIGGDQSRLFRLPPADRTDQRTRYLAFVRVGDLVAELDLYGVVDDAGARVLVEKAAQRLRS
ncbi:hypothetical protein [Virgisporangium aurantiacum]|uniref:Uncharacterized protein n=1 Tax=Virgisporangium aurantiacum TaxID=175570 RepID=A0A8J4E251_9ACTN|nr:hypothetical protein [Virgisporangium aurantiacum]GIJ56667.1 hypothetical protein Vau01_041830 [Virgisporangium aurantiacum]